jgi:hypothetical protein
MEEYKELAVAFGQLVDTICGSLKVGKYSSSPDQPSRCPVARVEIMIVRVTRLDSGDLTHR